MQGDRIQVRFYLRGTNRESKASKQFQKTWPIQTYTKVKVLKLFSAWRYPIFRTGVLSIWNFAALTTAARSFHPSD